MGGIGPLGEREISAFFSKHGDIESVEVLRGRDKQPRGFSFIIFKKAETVDKLVGTRFFEIGNRAVEVRTLTLSTVPLCAACGTHTYLCKAVASYSAQNSCAFVSVRSRRASHNNEWDQVSTADQGDQPPLTHRSAGLQQQHGHSNRQRAHRPHILMLQKLSQASNNSRLRN